MPNDNYILISLDDEKSKSIAEVLSSKTSKKIINYLAETKEASQKDLSDALKIPMNTMEYNIKKLLASGFIQKRKNFFWSKKGKKIIMYELSKKSIIISHKKSVSEKVKSILPAFILTGVGTFVAWVYGRLTASTDYIGNGVRQAATTANDAVYAIEDVAVQGGAKLMEVSPGISSPSIQPTDLIPIAHVTPFWLWFLIGSLVAITIVSLVNWKKL